MSLTETASVTLGMVTGITRRFPECYGDVRYVIEAEPDKVAIGYSIVVARHGTVFLADTSVNETPTAEQLATIARQMAGNARTMGHEPRVAFMSLPVPMQYVATVKGAPAKTSTGSSPRNSSFTNRSRARMCR